MSGPVAPPPEDPGAERDPQRPFPPGPLGLWIERFRGGLRPWGVFWDQRRFGVPRDWGDLGQRLRSNGENFRNNYGCVGLAMALYCLLSSPLLLFSLGFFVAVFFALRMRAQSGPLVLLGRELTPPQQWVLSGGVSLPLLWVAGAGAAAFWVLGATLSVIGVHAALREPETPGTPPLQMEEV